MQEPIGHLRTNNNLYEKVALIINRVFDENPNVPNSLDIKKSELEEKQASKSHNSKKSSMIAPGTISEDGRHSKMIFGLIGSNDS